jgi:hypothetical protein
MILKAFLLITAIGEGLTGVLLLLLPAVPLALLLGLQAAAPETALLARVAGCALIAIGLTSGMARDAAASQALRAILAGILVYDVAVAVVLAYAGIGLRLVGILLWPAVALHLILAVWCLTELRRGASQNRQGE